MICHDASDTVQRHIVVLNGGGPRIQVLDREPQIGASPSLPSARTLSVDRLATLSGPCEQTRVRRDGTCACLLPDQLVDKVLRGIRSGSDRELRGVKLALKGALDCRSGLADCFDKEGG